MNWSTVVGMVVLGVIVYLTIDYSKSKVERSFDDFEEFKSEQRLIQEARIDSIKEAASAEARFWEDEFNRMNRINHNLKQEAVKIEQDHRDEILTLTDASADSISRILSDIQFRLDSLPND